MLPLILCRERLARIQRILAKNAGALPVREFTRSFSVWEWEVEQAAALGWIKIETRKPRTGRPSRIAKEVSKPDAAKLPPYRWQMERPINFQHKLFAIHSTCAVKHGSRWLASHGFSLPCITDVYQSVFKRAAKRRAATASASRLMRRSDVRAARAWYYARFDGDAPRNESMPDTATGIVQRLRELGSWRVR